MKNKRNKKRIKIVMINSHTHILKKNTSGLEQYSDFINVYIASLLMGLSGQNWKFIYQFTMKKQTKLNKV